MTILIRLSGIDFLHDREEGLTFQPGDLFLPIQSLSQYSLKRSAMNNSMV